MNKSEKDEALAVYLKENTDYTDYVHISFWQRET